MSNDFDNERRPQGITRYVVAALAACIVLGILLYLDGAVEQATDAAEDIVTPG